ncbi:hypothetical protein BZA05DRAFT_391504 [Tricharina praecox]|uniref:uncharacterized protein n=1 Tax=Tricharina praecox TaxID=43433 RepID=UPI00221E5875|nr:uncharacterized protein BZA05DRAFT_391504 [Tricharina praecox]KAI5855416.1 hypothetical protein BZA05DRAFT_391504 [Tricharina praecox]
MAASNSVALFNGIPVDPMTGRPIVPPAEDEDEEPGTLTKRGLLKKKLGLQFLDDPNADENVIREAMNSQLIGTGLAAPKGTFDEQSETVDELADAAAAAESAAPAAATPEVPKKPKIQPWNSNSYMICNGVPVAVDGDVTNKALEVAKFTGPATSSLQKRGDIRNKFGFGMFDMPSVSGRRKTTQAPPAEDEEEYQEEEVEVVEEEEPAAVPAQKEKEAILPHPSQTMDEARGLPFDELPQGKSFVIYNGKPVEVNGSPFNGAKIKKPRPAFRGSRDNDYSRLAKRDPGRKYTGLNPFKPNPITGCHKDSRLSATSNDNGETNQERQEHHIEELSPHTTEQESINVKVGDSYALFNGRPIELAGKKPTPTPAPAPAEKQHPASLASGGMGFFNGMSA